MYVFLMHVCGHVYVHLYTHRGQRRTQYVLCTTLHLISLRSRVLLTFHLHNLR